MKFHKSFFYFILFTLSTACNSPSSENLTFANKIEKAHKKEAFITHSAIQFDLDLEFAGKKRLEGTIKLTTDSQFGIIEFTNGEEIYINKDKVYCSPGLKDNKSVRFDAYTWSYFFLFPFKLNDEGTVWTNYESKDTFESGKLSFKANIGDAPDDWYIVYADNETKVIDHIAYIVTAGKTKEEAEKDPHAIQYLDYKNIDGIPLSHKWIFWEWREDKGLVKELGNATIRNIQFIEDFRKDFNVPESYIER